MVSVSICKLNTSSKSRPEPAGRLQVNHSFMSSYSGSAQIIPPIVTSIPSTCKPEPVIVIAVPPMVGQSAVPSPTIVGHPDILVALGVAGNSNTSIPINNIIRHSYQNMRN